jgi:hypothetical protein
MLKFERITPIAIVYICQLKWVLRPHGEHAVDGMNEKKNGQPLKNIYSPYF